MRKWAYYRQRTETEMRPSLLASASLALLCMGAPADALKTTKYPEVKVELADTQPVDASFETMRKALQDAIAKKDAAALFALVGSTFVWTVQAGPTDQFDRGRDALHNFKVAFGFREFGKDADGPVENGPFWEALAEIARAAAFDKPEGAGNLLCGPLSAMVDNSVLERASAAIETEDESADWYYTQPDTVVAKAPGDNGPPVAKVGRIALAVLDVHPPAPEGQPAPPATHYQVLLPSGKTGWIAVAAAKPLAADRLCYSKRTDGSWRISGYDQNQ